MHTVKKLQAKKFRDESGLFIVEGEKFVREIPAHWDIQRYIFAERFVANANMDAFKTRARCEIVTDAQFDSFSDTLAPQGVLAICHQKKESLENLTDPSFFLLGENLSDPGNIGTLIRTAAAAGVTAVILTSGSGEIYNPKVIRASAGAILRIPVITTDTNAALDFLQSQKIALYAAHPRGESLPYELDMRGKGCILIGNEVHGLSDEILTRVDQKIRLPMHHATESLNASVAGGILLYEVVRQRLSPPTCKKA